MSTLDILTFPDPRLRRRAGPVAQVDDALRTLIDALFNTMYQADGVGLAATQVNVTQRLMVIDVSQERDEPLVFINPETSNASGTRISEEGCLSVPGYFASVKRAESVHVTALDRAGEKFEMDAEGLLATCIQHEIDHLDGKLFVDYLSPLKRRRVRQLVEKQKREGIEPERGRRAI